MAYDSRLVKKKGQNKVQILHVFLYEALFLLKWFLNLATWKRSARNLLPRTLHEVVDERRNVCVFDLSEKLSHSTWNRKIGSDISANLVKLAEIQAYKTGALLSLYKVQEANDWLSELGEEMKGSTILITEQFISFLAFYPKISRVKRLKQCCTLAIILRNQECAVIFPLPDPYCFAVNAIAMLMSFFVKIYILPLVTLGSNATLATGVPSLSPSILPNEHLAGLPFLPWSERSCEMLVSTQRGGRRRKELSTRVSRLASKRGIATSDSGFDDTYQSYIEKVLHSKAYLNLNEVQDYYMRGRLVRFFPKDMTTGRCYEAFAAGCLLVCNQTPLLAYFGFAPHKHFWPLPENKRAWVHLLNRLKENDQELRLIAEQGRHRLHLLWANEAQEGR